MLNKLSIKSRMIFYILSTVLVFALVGYFSQLTLNQDALAKKQTSENLKTINASSNVNYTVNKEYTQLLLNINMGNIKWSDAAPRIREGLQKLQLKFAKFNSSLPHENLSKNAQKAHLELFNAQDSLIKSFVSLQQFFRNYIGEPNQNALNTFAKTSMINVADNVVVKVNAITDVKFSNILRVDAQSVEHANIVAKNILVTLGIGAFIALIFGLLLMYSIIKPTNNLTRVIKRLSDGEFNARAKVTGSDEIAELSNAFNGLLDDRAVTLQKIDEEHTELNQSVFSLLQAVADLSERDLTIRANVTEDATGPVADALNLLAEETSDTLKKVKNVAFEVNETSQKVNTHLMSVNELSMKEQKGALETSQQMNVMLQRLDSIANSAAETNTMADTASLSTKRAHESVTDTLGDMSNIRSTVQETGKRIKQLGERSKEISHVIDIINTIAERTTVLALNASMQAVKAGDAGKGFSVIAEEIQRLAESSRDSTGQISTLVKNIQQETNMTIDTMEKTIEQVIGGSTKAEDAAKQMQYALETTNELVEAVDKIAVASLDQVSISKDLKIKAESILESSQDTGQELLSLTGLSRNMSDYAQQLVASVNVFTLEKNEKSLTDSE